MGMERERLEWDSEAFEARRRDFDARCRAAAAQPRRIEGPVLPPVCAKAARQRGCLARFAGGCGQLAQFCRRSGARALRRPRRVVAR
jgi:hypothetical protein